MSEQEFLSSIQAGQYIKTKYRDTTSVRKVSKVTRTQIVISEWGWGDQPHVDRFRISNGYRVGDSWYYSHRIIPEPVSAEEIAAYEARIAEAEWMRKERKRIAEVEAWAKERLVSLFGQQVPAENIKIGINSNDGLKTVLFEIKCEKISEEVLRAALEQTTPQAVTA